MAISPDAIRSVVAEQRSVAHSVAALIRGICSQLYVAVDTGNMDLVAALADHIAANGPAWCSAVTQNTPLAAEVDVMSIDMTRVPQGMHEVFVPPGAARGVKAEPHAPAEHVQEPNDKHPRR